jgi:hypothetical protein
VLTPKIIGAMNSKTVIPVKQTRKQKNIHCVCPERLNRRVNLQNMVENKSVILKWIWDITE